jgi:hypothetical protein
MRSTSFLAFSAMLLTLSCTALAALAAEIHCPASITETPTVATEDWQWMVVASSGERQLERVGIYLGTRPSMALKSLIQQKGLKKRKQ